MQRLLCVPSYNADTKHTDYFSITENSIVKRNGVQQVILLSSCNTKAKKWHV